MLRIFKIFDFRLKHNSKKRKEQLPELMPCLIDINPTKIGNLKLFSTPKTHKKKGKLTRINSPENSLLTHNDDPRKLSNFKKRMFSYDDNSGSKVLKIQNVSRDRKNEPPMNVLVPLDRIVHERCYNQYLFPNKTLWKYLNSINYDNHTDMRPDPPKKKKKKTKKINLSKKRKKIAKNADEQISDAGFLNITTREPPVEEVSEDDSVEPNNQTVEFDAALDAQIQKQVKNITKFKAKS